MIEKSVHFLESVQRFVKAVETVFIDTVSTVIPWLSPLVPAFMAFRAMSDVLAFPFWLAAITAGVIELLGLATINTAFSFWNYNQEKRKIDPRSPVQLAVLVTLYYLVVVLVVNTMLDNSPDIHKVAKGLLSSISIVGGVTIALRASHSRRVNEIRTERERIRAERKGVKNVSAAQSLQLANEAKAQKRAESIERTYAYIVENPDARISDIARETGKSRPTIYDYLNELKAEGRIKENGHREVL
jgi:hypothetical protein